MIITTKRNAPKEEIESIVKHFESLGFRVNYSVGEEATILGLIGDTTKLDEKLIEANIFVERVTRISSPFKLASRAFHPEDTIVEVGNVKIGGKENIAIIGGPCSVEENDITRHIADEVKKAGATMLRGGAYKPRTSPYAFQGMGHEGIVILKNAGNANNMPIVSEIMSEEDLQDFVDNVDLIQVGARNMQNFSLLKALGKIDKPILLKRGLANTIEEWLMSAEYILAGGNKNVILCERGIRTFEKYTRNTLDLSVVPLVKKLTHLPIVIDPSHATGKWDLVESMSLAAIACGADGLIIEVHTDPEHALSDGAQSLKPKHFKELIEKGKAIANVIGRDI